MKYLIGLITAVVALGIIYFGPEIKQHFGERYADADREIFENSKPFLHGTIENLNRLRLQHDLATSKEHKDAIRVMVVTQIATIDKNQLPYDLQQWVNTL